MSPAKSVKRLSAVALLGVLICLCAGAIVLAAGGKPDFALSPSPSSQTVTAGQDAAYTIQLTRQNSYVNAVTLSASGLPPSTTASFSPNPIPAATATASNSSRLTIKTNVGGATPAGTHKVTVTGTDGKVTRTTTVTLTVQVVATANFSLSASPAVQTITQGDDAVYTVNLIRTGGFTGAVALSATGLASQSGAIFSPVTIPAGATQAKLTVSTTSKVKTGSFTFAIDGTATVGDATVTRTASATVDVQQTKEFGIAGNPGVPLVPGVDVPLDLAITNPHNQAIKITSLSVAVEEATDRAGCSGSRDFAAVQVPPSRYPIGVPANATRTLSQLGVSPSAMPKVTMLNRPVNQNACKGASIHLQYSGTATK